MYEKLTIVRNKRFGERKRHFRTTLQCMTLDCVRPISLDIWRVERCVCVWPSRLSIDTSSSTALTLSSASACFGLPLSCLWSVLPASRIYFSKVSRHFVLQFIFDNSSCILREPYSLNWYELIINALSSLLNVRLHY